MPKRPLLFQLLAMQICFQTKAAILSFKIHLRLNIVYFMYWFVLYFRSWRSEKFHGKQGHFLFFHIPSNFSVKQGILTAASFLLTTFKITQIIWLKISKAFSCILTVIYDYIFHILSFINATFLRVMPNNHVRNDVIDLDFQIDLRFALCMMITKWI